mgnify:CR=1 FL=1
MKFTQKLLKGKFLKRYKRFFVDIHHNGQIITAHCPNTGSMKGLLDKGNEVFLKKYDDPKRKLKYGLEISLEEAASGITTDIRVPSWEGCSDCGSSGCKKGTKPEVCSSCGGQGQVRMQQGFFSIQQTCPNCRGVGRRITSPWSSRRLPVPRAELIFPCVKLNGPGCGWRPPILRVSRRTPHGGKLPQGQSMRCWRVESPPVVFTRFGFI